LFSRGKQNYSNKYQAVADEMSGLADYVVDGEVMVLNNVGKPDFGALQNYQRKGDIAYSQQLYSLLKINDDFWQKCHRNNNKDENQHNCSSRFFHVDELRLLTRKIRTGV
jgi:hypothetical protein